MTPWQEAVAVEDLGPADVRYGSIATEEAEAAGRVCPLCAGDLNRSTQHLLILLDREVADGDVTDIVHGEAEG